MENISQIVRPMVKNDNTLRVILGVFVANICLQTIDHASLFKFGPGLLHMDLGDTFTYRATLTDNLIPFFMED